MASNTQSIQNHLKSLYTTYRRTTDIDAKGLFFSPESMQLCRPQPTYAAKDRQTIVQFLHEAVKMGTNLATDGQSDGEEPPNATNWKRCTIRPIREDEVEFASDEITTPAGFTASDLKQKAKEEGWAGMRIDLWFADGFDKDILVKVRYWWRKEGGEWLQILHDIMYMGPRDGTEGTDGELL